MALARASERVGGAFASDVARMRGAAVMPVIDMAATFGGWWWQFDVRRSLR